MPVGTTVGEGVDVAARAQAKATERNGAKATRALATLEARIDNLESALASVTIEIEQASAVGSLAAINELGQQYEARQVELNGLMDHWSDLAGQG